MNAPSETPTRCGSNAILAAGGIVLGAGVHADQIALVRRRRYKDEIALPKGKVRGTESIRDTAVREVGEETGFKTSIRGYAGTTRYLVGRSPKLVFYFLMDLEAEISDGPSDQEEIAAVEWASPAAAMARLTHRDDRDLVAAVFGIPRGRQS